LGDFLPTSLLWQFFEFFAPCCSLKACSTPGLCRERHFKPGLKHCASNLQSLGLAPLGLAPICFGIYIEKKGKKNKKQRLRKKQLEEKKLVKKI
jgi:hypothetical protein